MRKEVLDGAGASYVHSLLLEELFEALGRESSKLIGIGIEQILRLQRDENGLGKALAQVVLLQCI